MDLGAPTHRPPEAAGTPALRYADRAGIPSLREALYRRITHRSGFRGEPFHVTVTAGASMAFTSAVAGLTKAGDRVLLPDPGYPAYSGVVRALARTPEHYSLARLFDGSQELLKQLPGAVLLVLNSPSNPTGQTLSEPILSKVVAAAREHGLLIISDEVYADLAESVPVSPASLAPERTLVLDSISKTFALAGARVGCAAGPADLIGPVTRANWLLGMSVSEPSQRLALGALTARDGYLDDIRMGLTRKRHLSAGILREYGFDCAPPDAGIFLWLDVSQLGTGKMISEVLQRTVRVSVTAGEPFGPHGSGHIRISCAGDEADVAEGTHRIGRTLAALRRRVSTRGKSGA
ncbi:pyridoxal phosphate-dependent aminotransferase [Streptomyces celluloflavus]|uniref:Aminotransferase n=1 Tax=Streptomyces celluloflavus TaxID=58344 RepID=A0ABW7RKV1_9ACTN